MNIVAIVLIIAIFFINFIFIDKIFSIVSPTFKNEDDIYYSKSKDKLTEALIYGEEVFCTEIYDILIHNNISSKIFNDLEQIDKSYSYKFLIAVNKSDLENLIVCSVCKNVMEVSIILAICNNQQNKRIYDKNHIQYVCGNSFLASDIVSILLSMQEGGD